MPDEEYKQWAQNFDQRDAINQGPGKILRIPASQLPPLLGENPNFLFTSLNEPAGTFVEMLNIGMLMKYLTFHPGSMRHSCGQKQVQVFVFRCRQIRGVIWDSFLSFTA